MQSNQSLLASAKQFLIEAFINRRERKLNFAIVHAVTATELVLKERLARIHPTLIYNNIDAANFSGLQTVSLSKLPQRLINLGVRVERKEVELIKKFANWRNQIVHHMPLFDDRTANQQLPRLLDFLAGFLRRELDTPLEEFLPTQLYKTAAKLLKEWERVVQEAKTHAQREGSVLSEPCPDCGAADVLCLRDEERVFCHLCAAHNYRYDRCTECGRKTVSSFAPLDTGNYCDSCIDAAGDQYVQMLIDIERGK
jgi:hypothetical protein